MIIKSQSLTTLSFPKNVLLPKPEKSNKPERISAAGVGNAALVPLAVDAAKAIFTLEDNKSATKGDLKRLTAEINGRYHLVKNMPARYDGALAYFDMQTQCVEYF